MASIPLLAAIVNGLAERHVPTRVLVEETI